MFTSEMIIAVFFKIVNFIILIGLAAYILKKYGIQALTILLAKKEAEYDSLLSHQLSLEESQFDLDKKIEHDSQLCNNLKEKINKWQTAVSSDYEIKKSTHLARMEVVNQNIQKKIEYYRLEQIKKSVHDSLVIQLEKSLSCHFDSTRNGHIYLEEIIKFMDKNTL